MKSFALNSLFCFLINLCTIQSVSSVKVDEEFVESISYGAKIVSNNGDLIIEAARNKNITFRLTENACFLINDIDVLDILNKYSIAMLDNSLGITGDHQSSASIGTSLTYKVSNLRVIIDGVASRVRNLENRTASMNLSQLRARIRTIEGRVGTIETTIYKNECESQPCKHGGTCIDLYDNYFCYCPPNWEGSTCEEDVDECYKFSGTNLGCQNMAKCINTAGSYRCECTNNWVGLHCTNRNTDCATSSSYELCAHGVCINTPNSLGYTCICEQGWTRNNLSAACTVDINECLTGKHNCVSECINLPGSYTCGPCPSGYTGNGVSCMDINECAINNGGCSTSPKVNCINTEGSYRCGDCPIGWSGDGKTCLRSDKISCENVCHPSASCQYISNTVVCTCPPGMTGHGFGQYGCSKLTSPCIINPCKNGGTCFSNGTVSTCICPPGFRSLHCEHVTNPCEPNPCQNGGTCIPKFLFTSFTCTCPNNYAGETCNQLINSCGGVIRQSFGILRYPVSGLYEPNKRCAWVFKTDENKVLNVTFSKFDLKEKDASVEECNKDWLQIHDGQSSASVKIGRFCGTTLPKGGKFTTSHNKLYIWFRSDNGPGRTGFELQYNSTVPSCGGVININSYGVIKSPGYPGYSSPNRHCEWEIRGPLANRIHLTFFEVNLGKRPNCTGDYLSIIDGDHSDGEIIEKFCETTNPEPIYSSSSSIIIVFHTDDNGFDSSFQLHYSVVEGNPSCGGYFTATYGTFSSPEFSSILLRRTICQYVIHVPEGTKIEIKFPFIEASNLLCSHSYVEVYDGKTDSAPLLNRICTDNSVPEKILSSSNYLLVKHQSHAMINPSINIKFKAEYKMICDFEFKDTTGVIKSPRYPSKYLSGLRCVYSIQVPVNNIIELMTDTFSLAYNQNGEGKNCTGDYVNIYYPLMEAKNLRNRVCQQTNLALIVPYNHLYLEFITSESSPGASGFKLWYEAKNLACGGVITNKSGTIISPDKFSTSLCEWIIIAPNGASIYVVFDVFEVQETIGCTDDWLKIFANSSEKNDLIGKFCGNNKPPSLSYMTNILTIQVHVSHHSTASRFQAKYEIVDGVTVCGGNYSAPSGSIKSPGWPKNYLPSKNCIWIIHAPIGNQIELTAESFLLEGLDCRYDYLEIRNGKTQSAPLIGKYCESTFPSRIISYTNHIWIHFASDSSEEYNGFDIRWKQTSTGCGGELRSYEGSIQSPHYPDILNENAQCEWKIHVGAGSKIQINITTIPSYVNLCESSFLTVFDGINTLVPKIKFNCSSLGMQSSLKSSGNDVIVRFTTRDNGYSGFYLTYRMDCIEELRDISGAIESPNFPDEYPLLINCEWKIFGKHNNRISLAFSHLDLEEQEYDCPYDTLQVIDIKKGELLSTRPICKFPNEIITSVGDEMVIKFNTDASNSGTGFRIEYQIKGCGGILRKNYESFASNNAPYSVDVYCEWIIQAPPGQVVQLNIQELYFESSRKDCSANALIVFDDKERKNILSEICESEKTDHKITSTGQNLYIKFYTNAVQEKKYFKAIYRFQSAKCGGIVQGVAGNIYSPNYPNGYPANITCEWEIITESHHRLEVFFVELKLGNSSICEHDYVELKNGLVENSSGRRYCGNFLPTMNMIRSTNGRMLVTFKSGDKAESGGFNLHYQRNCGKDIDVSFDVGYISKGFNDKDCIWRLKAKEIGSHVTLVFSHLQCSCEGTTDKECSQNKGIQVYEGDSIASDWIFSICKANVPQIVSSGNSLTVYGKTGYFEAYYSSYENNCGGQMTSLRGNFASPGFRNLYPINIECIWNIKAENGYFITLRFIEMDISKSENCNEDYIEIREQNENGKILGIFCDGMPNELIKAYEQMWIKFRSDEDGVGRGFLAYWEYDHDNEINKTEGIIKSPPLESIRDDPINFSWRILVPRRNLVIVMFKEYVNGLKVYDGYDETAPELVIESSPSELTSHTNAIYIQSNNEILQHFLINWKTTSRDAAMNNLTGKPCTNEIITLIDYAFIDITSPGYPHGYENNLDCEWIIKTNISGTHASLYLRYVDLEQVSDCAADFVEIYSSDNLINWKLERKSCNSNSANNPSNGTFHGRPFLKIKFHTDVSDNRTGFSGLLAPLCGGVLTDPEGVLNGDTGSALLLKNVMNCSWSIRVRPGHQIKFEFTKLNIAAPKSGTCEGYVSIRDGIDEHSPHLGPGRYCSGVDIEHIPLTTSHRAFVIFSFTDFSQLDWELTYKEYSEDCRETIMLTNSHRKTNITTPNYPSIPKPYTECIWVVNGPPGEELTLEFIGLFDLTRTSNCSDEYVTIKDGSTDLATTIGTYCRKPFNPISSTTNSLYIKYVTNVAEPRNGFCASIGTSKCGGVFYRSSGEITSPNYPTLGSYPSNYICNYTIRAPSSSRIRLSFDDIDLPYSQNSTINDYIALYDIQVYNDEIKENKIISIYGNNSIPNYETESKEVIIRFFTFRQTFNHRGFKISYTRLFGLCSDTYYRDSGNITVSSKVFRRNELRPTMHTCRWKIIAKKGQKITANVAEFVESSSVAHSYQMMFYNDFYGLSSITSKNNSTFSSTDNSMLIILKIFQNSTFLSARISYSTYSLSSCPDDIKNNSAVGEITLAPDLSDKNFYCSSKFSANNSETLAFNVEYLISPIKYGRLIPIKFSTYFYQKFAYISGNVTNKLIAIPITGKLEIIQTSVTELPRIDFKITYKRHPCGGIINYSKNFTLELLKTNLTDSYGKIDCAWKIRQLYYSKNNFTGSFNLTDPDCEKEYVNIHNGMTLSDVKIAKICHGNTNFTYMPTRSGIYVHYHAERFSKSSSIKIYSTPKTNCGGKLMNLNDNENTINFGSNDYKNNQECIWEYDGQSGFSTRIEFFGRFFIEDSKDCVKDSLQIQYFSEEYDEWKTLKRVCGRHLPDSFNTTNTKLRIIFRTDENNVADGFNLRLITYCGGIYEVSDVIRELQLNYPSYMYSLNCNYSLISKSNNLIKVIFKDFYLDSSESCTQIAMEVYKQPTESYYDNSELTRIGKYCKRGSISQILGKNHIVLSLKGYYYGGFISFYISFSTDKCGGNITTPSKIDSIINQNDFVAIERTECIWNIIAPENKHIAIRFEYLDIISTYNCESDYVSVYSTNITKLENLNARLCGNLTKESIRIKVNDNTATIVRNIQDTQNLKGFVALVQFVEHCDYKFYMEQYNSTYRLNRFLGSYENNLDCHYIFQCPKDYNLKIVFNSFDVNKSSSNDDCTKGDYVEVRDGDSMFSELIGRYCGSQIPPPHISLHHTLFLRFVSDDSYTAKGFDATINIFKSDCGTQDYNLNEKEAIIEFPNSSEYYPANTVCHWTFNSDSAIEFVLERFELEDQSESLGQCVDYLEFSHTVYFGYDEKMRFCGSKIPSNLRFGNDKTEVVVSFKSNSRIQKKGFKLVARKFEACNQNYTGLSNKISINNADNMECVIYIKVPENYMLTFHIYHFEMNKDCSQKNLEIYDEKAAVQLLKLCKTNLNRYDLFTNTSFTKLKLKHPEYLNIYYISSQNGSGCGGRLISLSGTFTSPMYPNPQRKNMQCRWEIHTAVNKWISFYFEIFDMGSRTNCEHNFVKILRLLPNGREEVINTFCGDDDPSYYATHANNLALVYNQTVNFDGSGWVFHYDSIDPETNIITN